MKKKTFWILIAILILALFLRFYKFKEFYIFSHDQDLASWVVKDILVNKHLRLIGQETSSKGVFIGALFYYLQIPFYLIGKMNPLPTVFLPMILGVFATFSVYFVISNIKGKKEGLIAALIYGASSLIVFTDREVAPTMPVMLWSVWYLYSLFLLSKNEQLKGFVLWGILLTLIWHLNLALVILSPLIVLPFLFSKKKIKIKALAIGIAIAVIGNLPFLFFEYRHGFNQINSVFLSLTSQKDFIEGTATGFSKFDRVMQLVTKNSISIFSRSYFVSPWLFFVGLVLIFVYLLKTKKINYFWGTVIFFWQSLYILFFSLNSLNVSEYYFNGMNIIWIFIVSVFLADFILSKKYSIFIYIILGLFVIHNTWFVFNVNSDKKGFVEKTALIKEIKQDSQKHNYPCISISYITSPGYELGYRYLFWLENMHVNDPSSGSPVYTIVFPHSLVDKIDNSFGSLGLIYPDYQRYNEKDVEISCQGANANLTNPMFGYTE